MPIKRVQKVDPRSPGLVTLESSVFPQDEARNRTASGNAPRLTYDINALNGGEASNVTPEKRLDYDISALPGRQRFHITNDGQEVIPATGAEALGYYSVSKKSGANISGLSAKMIPTIGEMAAAAADLRLPKPVITAGSNGKHKKNSLHYKNLGLDYRGNNITDAQGRALGGLVQTRLGQDYDAFFEQPDGKPPAYDHFHAEYDPPKIRR